MEHLLLYRELVVVGMGCSHAPLLSRPGEFHCSVLPLHVTHYHYQHILIVLAAARNGSNFILVSSSSCDHKLDYNLATLLVASNCDGEMTGQAQVDNSTISE